MSLLKVDYILFSHLAIKNEKDAVNKFSEYVQPLARLLDRDTQGLLILFYDPGWLELLNTVGVNFDPIKFVAEFQKSDSVQKQINSILQSIPIQSPPAEKRTLEDRVRFITTADLYPIVNNLRGDRPGLEATRLRRFLGGNVKGMLYDTSKVVEAVIRLRHIGSSIPIFRLDWDALFNEDSLASHGNLIAAQILKSKKNYEECISDTRIYSFLFSGSYKLPNFPYKPSIDEWTTAFATRIFPSLVPTEELINSIGKVENEDLQKGFDLDLTLRFYGLDKAQEHCLVRKTKEGGKIEYPKGGITSIGSNPLSSVISGALLCLSDGAILDLPPFSNFRMNVLWIDDHLKYALHRELSHLSRYRIQDLFGNFRKARINGCEIFKARPPIENIGSYTLGSYLPTLLWGAIVDAWIQPNPSLNVAHIEDEQLRPERSPFVKTLKNVLRRGFYTSDDQNLLKAELEKIALERIEDMRSLWSDLKTNTSNKTKETFASLWVGEPGKIKKIISARTRSQLEIEEEWTGWGLLKKKSANMKINSVDQLNPKIQEGIKILIDDAINYIEWTLEWPRFVQSVRSVEQGNLRMDLNWRPEKKKQKK